MKSMRLGLKQSIKFGHASRVIGFEDNGDTGGTGDDGNKDGKTGSEDGKTGDDGKSKGDPEAAVKAAKEEKDRHYAARQAAERERDELAQWKKDKEAEGQTETEKRDNRIKELETSVEASASTVKALAIENAFLKVNDVVWQNPARALALVDLSGIEPDKNGKIDADEIKKRIKALADSDPYLVKGEDKSDDKDDKSKKGSSGTPPKGKQSSDTPDLEALARKYPGLRSRQRPAART